MIAFKRMPAKTKIRFRRNFRLEEKMRLHTILLLVAFLVTSVISCNGGGSQVPTSPTYPAGKPANVKAVAGSKSATVSWNSVSGANGYYVYMSSNGTKFNRVEGGLLKNLKFTVLNLTNGQTYYFGVTAVGVGGWETGISYAGGSPTAMPVVPSLTPIITPDPEDGNPPDPPKNLQGIAKDASVELQWANNSESDFAFYRIYSRQSGAGDFSRLIDNYTDTEIRITDLVNGNQYEFYITAVDNETERKESNPSNVVFLRPQNFPPEKPTNLKLYVNPGRVLLEWDISNEPDIKQYAIERVEGVDPGSGAEIVARFKVNKPTGSNPTLYANGFISVWADIDLGKINLQDTAIVIGSKYTYRISAIDTANQEGSTAEIVMTTPVI